MWVGFVAFVAALGVMMGTAAAVQSPAAEDAPTGLTAPLTAPNGIGAASVERTAQVVTLPTCKPGQIC